jgi:replicative DNA helicase
MKRDDEVTQLRVPPHSLEAEQSVLGGLMLDNGALDRVGDMLVAGDFYRFEHRAIYAAIAALISSTKPADVITVHEQLQRSTRPGEDWGGLQYLNALAQCVPSAANIGAYARIVREHAERRALIAALRDAEELVWSDATSLAETRERIGALLSALERRTAGKEPRVVGELALERADHYTDVAEGRAEPGTPSGIARLDSAFGGGLKPGRLIVLGARPSVGKTSLAGQIASYVAGQGQSVLVLSQEMTAGELVDRFIANAGSVHLGRLTTGRLDGDEWSRISDAIEDLQRRSVFIDDTPALTLQQIRAKARQVKRKHGLALLVLDHLQLCGSTGGAEKRHHQIEQISRGLKALAKELDITVLLLSQLNRASTERDEPELSDLKESGAIEEDADAVLLLHPMGNEPDGSLLVLLKLGKNRGGPRGRLAMSFDGRTQRWAESSGNVERRSRRGQE